VTASAPRGRLAQNTVIVGASFAMAAAMGLLRNMVIARQFGIGADLDAYYAAFKLPELLFTIVAGGALATAFIPVLADHLGGDDLDSAWGLVSSILNLVILIVTALAVMAGVLAPLLVRHVIAPGFDPVTQAETARLMRLVLISTLVFGVSAVQTATLHGMQHFVLPALAPIMYPVGIMAGAVWLSPTLGVRGLAVGAILGALLHLSIQVPGMVRRGYRWRPVLGLRNGSVHRVAALMGPRVLDLATFHFMLLVTTNLGSRLGEGSVSALEWGWGFMQLPETMIGTALGLVALPTLAGLARRNDVVGLRSTLSGALRVVVLLTVPAAVGLILLGRPLLAVLYQRGAFDAAATEAVYIAVRFYAVGLVGHASLELAARAFFAQQDTVTPLIIAVGAALLDVALALSLMRPLGHGGLALANAIAISVEVVVLLLVLRRRWQGVGGRAIASTLIRAMAMAAAMVVVVLGVMGAADRVGLAPLPLVLLATSAGALTYLAAGFALRLEELGWILAARPLRWLRKPA
jgi:putative peptidoglycan lipid II flippase